jgi:hypothetical protein
MRLEKQTSPKSNRWKVQQEKQEELIFVIPESTLYAKQDTTDVEK